MPVIPIMYVEDNAFWFDQQRLKSVARDHRIYWGGNIDFWEDLFERGKFYVTHHGRLNLLYISVGDTDMVELYLRYEYHPIHYPTISDCIAWLNRT